jgi:hypothetical protein
MTYCYLHSVIFVHLLFFNNFMVSLLYYYGFVVIITPLTLLHTSI